jgi:periodic tryptophan protein 2
VIYHFNFKAPPTSLAFAPSGRFFAIGLGKQLQIWRTPGFDEAREREFAPFVKYRTYNGHYNDITSVNWSGDSRFLVTTGSDLTARVWSLDPEEGFTPTTLSGHRDTVINAFFSSDQEIVSLFNFRSNLRFTQSVEMEHSFNGLINLPMDRTKSPRTPICAGA